MKAHHLFQKTLLLALTGTTLSACGLLNTAPTSFDIDCQAAQSSCHEGRFSVSWKIAQPNGNTQADSLSGVYEWRSGMNPAALETSVLELNSTLGPMLGEAKQIGDYFEARAADGRVYIAQDWQSLFDLILPTEITLPADALVAWMKHPNLQNLPPLPPNWSWQNSTNRYRIAFLQGSTSGRIDLIPKQNTP